MKKYYLLALLTLTWMIQPVASRGQMRFRWWNPAESTFPVIRGQAWPNEVLHPYDRLPARARDEVNPSVWKQSQDAAGLTIRFHANAASIRVRYTVSEELYRPHIPETGKSGLDLYAIDKNGTWTWTPAWFSFGDTIEYRFNALPHEQTREYCLYLPYYNHVNWLEIGVPDDAEMRPIPAGHLAPIVVYGTSIAQGTAAPRPGLTWVAVLGRRLNAPVVNLGFAGCGRLDTPVIRLMAELDAKLYVLDCLPNLSGTERIKTRLSDAVKILQQKRPKVPILIVDHADAHVVSLNANQLQRYRAVNKASRETYELLQQAGAKNIYYLSADSIGLNASSMASDGVHPNAAGMEFYAKAYENAIRKILHEATDGD